MTESIRSFSDELEQITLEKSANAAAAAKGALIGGGIGAALGGLAGYAGGGEKAKPTKKDRREAALYAAISGAVTGSLLGASVGALKPSSKTRQARNPFSSWEKSFKRRQKARDDRWNRDQAQWDRDFSRIWREAREKARRAREAGRGQQGGRRGNQRAGGSVRFRQKAGPKPEWMGDVKSKDEAKKKWRAAFMKVHPDHAKSTKQRKIREEKAKKINAEWDAWQAGRSYKNLKTKISMVLTLRGMDAENFRFLTSGGGHVV